MFAIVGETACSCSVIDSALISHGSVLLPRAQFRGEYSHYVVWWILVRGLLEAVFLASQNATTQGQRHKSVAFIDNGLASYQDRYGLSAREVEVLREVLLGRITSISPTI